MPSFVFTKFAGKKFRKLDVSVQNRILKKLEEMRGDGSYRSTMPLADANPATHRLRVGDYRFILQQKDSQMFRIIDVGHRSTIYR